MPALLLRIHGRVQGVGYRAWTADTARGLGLQGWVRNRRDGTVEALLIGSDDMVDTMLQQCRQGPPLARVERIEVVESADQSASGFNQLPTE